MMCSFLRFTVIILRLRTVYCLFIDIVRMLVINWSCMFVSDILIDILTFLSAC